MIQITPYYNRPQGEGDKIFHLYLTIVADVVPFLREDVLYDFPEKERKKEHRARKRTQKYQALLDDYKVSSDYATTPPRIQDAILAQRLIKAHASELHKILYEGITDESSGRINPEALRNLLIVKMAGGQLPKEYHFKTTTEKDLFLDHVFRYDSFSDHPKIYDFVELLNVAVCPYCNRQFTTTISTGGKKTRPQLDHFKNKSTYPHLALSINNLIPSCGICNHIKSDIDEDILYPYDEGMGELYTFQTKDKNGDFVSLRIGAERASDSFEVELVCNGDPTDPAVQRGKNSIAQLALNELYRKSHNDYITYMYRQRYIHTDKMLEDIAKQFPFLLQTESSSKSSSHREEEGKNPNAPSSLTEEELKIAIEGLKKTLFLMDYSQDAWKDRPLGKLTHDIAKEIEKQSKP